MYSSVDSLRQHPHAVLQHNPLQHSSGARGASADITTAADGRDQELGLDLPITYMPFKFENRRVRIDWRLLHGVDIDKLVGGPWHAMQLSLESLQHGPWMLRTADGMLVLQAPSSNHA